jgi:hypothetical protein
VKQADIRYHLPVSSRRAGAGQHGWMGCCWRSRWWRDGTLGWRRR